MLVEDDFTLRDLFVRVLEDAGYEVIAADNGRVALMALTSADPPFDVVITDSRMPVMSGPELIERIRATQPGIRIIQASGDDRPPARGVINLLKPFMPDELVAAVRRVLSPGWVPSRRRDDVDLAGSADTP